MRKRFVSVLAMIFVLSVLSSRSYAFTLPDTGQTKCYDTTSGIWEVACAGTGQDGEYNINPMSYTDNGNGTITDNVTGLVWQKGENPSTYNWYQASGTYNATSNPSSQNVCGSLTLSGYSDWRLPTKKELITIVDYSITNPGPAINTTYFPNTNAGGYWSSTLNAYGTDGAWYVGFGNGYVGNENDNKVSLAYARCVRGGQSSASFTNNGNGTVTDNGTGLMWQQAESGTMTWANALTYCESLSLGGQSDWRLPNIKELVSIIDDTKYNPAIDTTYFPNTNAKDYWSSTPYAYGDGSTWSVNFYYASISGGYKFCNYCVNYARCVRGGRSGIQNNCAASVSSSLAVHIPIVTYNASNYWADLQYNSSDSTLTVSNAGIVSDVSPYSNCTASSLSSDFKLHIPVLMLNNISYWIDLQYNGNAFVITGYGQN